MSTVITDYRLDAQVGFLLRKAQQRHTAIFADRMIEDLTPTQFAAMAKLHELGAVTQNRLGRLTAMDAATIKGVIDRLRERGFAATRRDPSDGRRLLVDLTIAGRSAAEAAMEAGTGITEATLAPLTSAERKRFLELLEKIA
ncbi:MarR family winged helix-turn-helix transcriptional regulator [Minwuia sp.]|uniref:MarR family winged helix-turn-helix transcriptional regulator n=1 Tax=Minwuia sp. TaxID=2493630 RepID=UPI003A923491